MYTQKLPSDFVKRHIRPTHPLHIEFLLTPNAPSTGYGEYVSLALSSKADLTMMQAGLLTRLLCRAFPSKLTSDSDYSCHRVETRLII